MKERELRRMNREALLELLIERTEEVEGLRAQLAEAQRALEALRQERPQPVCEEDGQPVTIGSIAEAAVRASGVLEAAEQAAKIYLEDILHMKEAQERACDEALAGAHRQAAQIEADARAKAEAVVADARRMADERMAEAERQCAGQEAEARRRCGEMLAEARQDPSWRLIELSGQVERIIRENEALRGMFAEQSKKRKWRL